jgi:hypothetical protein
MHLQQNEELTHWLGNLLLRHFGQQGDLHFRKTTGPPIFIKLNFGESPIATSHLRAVVFHNPFEDGEGPPLCCLFLVAPVKIYRAVLTRSPEIITRIVDEMIEDFRRQCADDMENR